MREADGPAGRLVSMATLDDDRIMTLLALLRPAPPAWLRAAQAAKADR